MALADSCLSNPDDEFGVPILRFGGHSYQIIKSTVTQAEARLLAGDRCHKGHRGHLAIIDDHFENQFLLTNMSIAGVSAVWIGGSDEAEEGQWAWLDGHVKPVFWRGDHGGAPVHNAFTDWGEFADGTGEPNAGASGYDQEDCLTLVRSTTFGYASGHWNDGDCLNIYQLYDGFIVEYDIA
jgi:hypothetical protein